MGGKGNFSLSFLLSNLVNVYSSILIFFRINPQYILNESQIIILQRQNKSHYNIFLTNIKHASTEKFVKNQESFWNTFKKNVNCYIFLFLLKMFRKKNASSYGFHSFFFFHLFYFILFQIEWFLFKVGFKVKIVLYNI